MRILLFVPQFSCHFVPQVALLTCLTSMQYPAVPILATSECCRRVPPPNITRHSHVLSLLTITHCTRRLHNHTPHHSPAQTRGSRHTRRVSLSFTRHHTPSPFPIRVTRRACRQARHGPPALGHAPTHLSSRFPPTSGRYMRPVRNQSPHARNTLYSPCRTTRGPS